MGSFKITNKNKSETVIWFSEPIITDTFITLYYSEETSFKDNDDLHQGVRRYCCKLIPYTNEVYRIEVMCTESSFYMNGQPNGHASLIHEYMFHGYTDNESLIPSKI